MLHMQKNYCFCGPVKGHTVFFAAAMLPNKGRLLIHTIVS